MRLPGLPAEGEAMTLAELLAQWRACIADDRASGRNIQAQVRSEDADALELALAQEPDEPEEGETDGRSK